MTLGKYKRQNEYRFADVLEITDSAGEEVTDVADTTDVYDEAEIASKVIDAGILSIALA